VILGVSIALAVCAASCDPAAPAATRSPSREDPASPSSTTPAAAVPDEVKVLFVLDSSAGSGEEGPVPAFQAAELAFAAAALEPDAPPVDLVTYDLLGDPERLDALAAEVAADPTYVAAMTAPSLAGQRSLERLGLPVVSLSPRGRLGSGTTTWRRLVPRMSVLGAAVAGIVASTDAAGHGVCVAAPDGTRSALAGAIGHALPARVPVADASTAGAIAAAGCGVVALAGDPAAAAATVAALERPRPLVIGGPELREPTFLDDAGPAARGVEAVCGCADLSTSLALRAQRFIQDFQSQYGRAPGAGAVEAWDAAHLLLGALRDGGTTAGAVSAWLATTHRVDGLGGRYRFGADGELADPLTHVYRYRVQGGRWILEPPIG
jgi:ABC-type branched-subunit amino acid transport system substrate-binding protein